MIAGEKGYFKEEIKNIKRKKIGAKVTQMADELLKRMLGQAGS